MHKAQESGVKAKRPGSLRLVPATLLLNKGFTLLELIVVLFIVVLGFSAIGINLSSGNDSAGLKVAARDIVSALRYARGQALISHQETTLTLNLAENSYTVSSRGKVYAIPKEVKVTVVTAQSELNGEGLGNIRFFADGSSTGGRITLARGKASWQIDINWLTGQIELNDTDAIK
ncbi:MAG: GspH/FimT family pseudopilin [Methylococcaceae bacterium]